MELFGLTIGRRKAVGPLAPVDNRGGWFSIIRESFPGAWQTNVEVRADLVLAFSTVFACITLIAGDIGKLRIKLMQQGADDIWQETTSAAFSPVLRKPNRYQTRQKFIEQWIVSKLTHGNAYALKVRDVRGVVTDLFILDPNRVKPLVAPDGAVYYQLQADDLSELPVGLPAVPASEIIHDRMVCLFHPLVGISPIYACGLAATQGLKIQENSAQFFQNMSRPSGILTAPGQISDDTANRLKRHWEENYSGDKIGKIAVLGDGLKYEAMTVNAIDAQLVEQLKLSSEQVCSVFHVPPYMVGVGAMPTYTNIEALNQQYYSQCLQALIESCEACLDEGLGLVSVATRALGTEFDLDGLLRMDTATQIKTLNDAVGGGWMAPNEARAKRGMRGVDGGDTPYLQVQNYSLAALAKRDSGDPFAKPAPAPAPTPATDPAASPAAGDGQAAAAAAQETLDLIEYIAKGLECTPT
jgi:HK97 family phage portal protein